MSLFVAIASSAALSAVTLEPHVTAVEHHGARYEVTYQPHVRTKLRTVGAAAGTRPSTEQCRWSAELQVTRRVDGAGGASDPRGHKLLEASRVVQGNRAGRCNFVKAAVEADMARKLDRLQAKLAELAAEDRPALLAELSDRRAVAAN